MPHYRLTITLTLVGPVLTKDSTPAGYGVDAAFFKRDGALWFPGTHIEGKLREALRQLAAHPPSGITADRIKDLMGDETNTGRWAPARGRLHFNDFKLGLAPNSRLRYRVQIDPATGAASERMLLLLEEPAASGAEVTCKGEVFAWVDATEIEPTTRDLRLGLRWMRQLGSARTVGFGSLVNVDVQCSEPMRETPATVPEADALLLRIKPEGPFFLGQHTPRDNVLVSESTIPGGAIKGCLARAWEHRNGSGKKPRWFDQITITHAFPAAEGAKTRPVRTPLSLGWSGTRHYDLAQENDACLIDGEALTFRIDWKKEEYELDGKKFGWANPERELRVRTAIDPISRRAAEQKLFSLEQIRPGGCEWLARIDFSAVAKEERSNARREFAELLGTKLYDLGKTKVRAGVIPEEWDASSARCTSSTAPLEIADTKSWIITLQTPAILCDPRIVAQGRELLHAAYAAAFHEMSGQTLELRHFYARQSLAGGKYLWRRFQPGKPYNPWLLTDAGSVFALALADGADSEKAEKTMAEWLARGMPLPDWAAKLYAADGHDGSHWSVNPFLRENGYGEIAVNLDVHTTWHPETLGAEVDRFPLEQPPALEKIAEPQSNEIKVYDQAPPAEHEPDGLPDRWIITGTFTTEGPLHVGSGELKPLTILTGKVEAGRPSVVKREASTPEEQRAYGRDCLSTHYNAVVRDEADRPFIPGSGWKGPVRAEFARLFGIPAMKALLGTEELGGQVEFEDARFDPAQAATPQSEWSRAPLWEKKDLTAIEASGAIDRRTRTAAHEKLFNTEFVPARAIFKVRVTAQDIGKEDVARLLATLARFDGTSGGLKLGAESGNGWGRIRWTPGPVMKFDPSCFDAWAKGGDAGYKACETHAENVAITPASHGEVGAADVISIKLCFHAPLLVRRSEVPKCSGEESMPNARPRQTTDGHALLPARSFRGALRSQCERILRTLVGDAAAPDPTLTPEALHDISEIKTLSLAAQLFGAAGWRAAIECSDFVSAQPVSAQPQEFVAIDRFTGGSAAGRKFKWEAFWPERAASPLVLNGELRLDRSRLAAAGAERWAPGLLALALRDLAEGDIAFGGGCAKGYGACTAEIIWNGEPLLASTDAAHAVTSFRTFLQTDRPALNHVEIP